MMHPETECLLCGKPLLNKNKDNICDDCEAKFFFICTSCGQKKSIFELVSQMKLLDCYPDLKRKFSGPLCNNCYNYHKQFFIPLKIIKCVYCGRYNIKGEKTDYSCVKCDKYIQKCYECGEFLDTRTSQSIWNGTKKVYLCNSCWKINDRKFMRCAACGKRFISRNKNLNTTVVSFCDVCHTTDVVCEHCHGIYPKNEVKKVDGFLLCTSCIMAIRTCSDCGDILYIGNVVNLSSGVYCNKCAAKRNKLKKLPYNYAPPKFFYYGKSKDNLYLGFENEFYIKDEDEDITLSVMNDIMQHFSPRELYCVHDGTIGNYPYGHVLRGAFGFEIVSHPHTLTSLKNKDWSKLFNKHIIKHPSCGFHVHLTRKAFTTFHLYKFLYFIYNNKALVNYVSEREPNKYCFHNDTEKIFVDSKYKYKHKGPKRINRMARINLCNSHTIELRSFASVINTETLFKNLEFVHAVFYFTQMYKLKDMKRHKFFEFVKNKNSKYNNLYQFLDMIYKSFGG